MAASVPISSSSPTRLSDTLPTPGNSAMVKGTLVTSTSGGRTSIIDPFIGDVTGTSTASAGVLEQEQVVMSGIDAVMSVTVSEQEAIDLLNCFTITEQNTGYGMSGTAALDYGSADKLPLLDVEFDGKEDQFAAVLRKIVSTAVETAPNSHSSVITYFNEEMRRMLNAFLSNSGLIDMLEASNVDKVRVVLDVSGGVTDLEDKMSAIDDNTVKRRRLFATQVPIKNYTAYGFPEGTLNMQFLPLIAGDSITFVFDITVAPPSSLTATGSQVVSDTNDGMLSLQTTGQYATTLTTFVGETKRRVAFKATLHSGDKAFAKKYDEAALITGGATSQYINDASGLEIATAAVAAAPFSLWTDASMGAYPDPGAAPVLDMTDVELPYEYGGKATAAADASGYTWTVAMPLWDASHNEPTTDISGAADSYMATTWAYGDGNTVTVDKLKAAAAVTSLTAIVTDLSGAKAAASAAYDTALAAFNDASGAYAAGLAAQVTEESKAAAIADASANVLDASSNLAVKNAVWKDAQWMYYFAIDTTVNEPYSSPSHAGVPKTTATLEAELADKQAALQAAIDASGEAYDPALLTAFNDAAAALAEKQAAVALVSLYTTLYEAAAAAKTVAENALLTAEAALAAANALVVGSVEDLLQAKNDAEAVKNEKSALLATATANLAVAVGLYDAAVITKGNADSAYDTKYSQDRSTKFAEVQAAHAAWVSARATFATSTYATALALYEAYYVALAAAVSALRAPRKEWAIKKAIYNAYQVFAGRPTVTL